MFKVLENMILLNFYFRSLLLFTVANSTVTIRMENIKAFHILFYSTIFYYRMNDNFTYRSFISIDDSF